jgi:NADH:ubiquinone oxidoreductase subunit H
MRPDQIATLAWMSTVPLFLITCVVVYAVMGWMRRRQS